MKPQWEEKSLAAAYGFFYLLNMCAMWGGVLPFLPDSLATGRLADAFFAPSLTFEISFFALMVVAHRKPAAVNRALPAIALIPYGAGLACLGLLLLPETAAPTVAAAAGLLLGWSTAALFLVWELVFSTHPVEQVCREIVTGFIVGAVAYLVLALIVPQPARFAFMVVAFAFVTSAIVKATRALQGRSNVAAKTNLADRPPQSVIRHALRDYWRSILCIGVVGVCAGAMRGAAIASLSQGEEVNTLSMALLLGAAIAFLVFWNRSAITLTTTSAFRAFAPLAIIALFFVPWAAETLALPLSSLLFALLGCVNALAAVQALVAARARSLNPVAVYGAFAGTIWLMHDGAYMAAQAALEYTGSGTAAVEATTVGCLCALGLGLFISQGGIHSILSPQQVRVDNIELMRTAAMPSRRKRETGTAQDGQPDVVALRMAELGARYHLTEREREIATLIARGMTVRKIAEQLVISENTVRTHAKAIYAKLDIHKKTELLDLVSADRI